MRPTIKHLEPLRDQILSQNPTDQQKTAIFADELEFLLRAAPGSGKTWTSCRRFIWRGANWPYAAGGLALLSFTNAAIREFQAATIRIGRRDLLSDPNYVGTFDAFVERFILTPFGHLIVGTSKRPRLLVAPRPGYRNNNKLMAWKQLKGGKKSQVPAWNIVPFPGRRRVIFKDSDDLEGNELQLGQNDPVRELMVLGFYTHSQRVYWASRLLHERPHIADVIARRFPEIIIDEAQDTNAWLLVLLKFLRNKGTKITLVGDPDQCIYEFSMASAESLPALQKKWNILELPLSRSFRCNDPIALAVRSIGGNLNFTGCGPSVKVDHRPFIIREPGKRFARSLAQFERIIDHAGIEKSSSAILCRGHQQLEDVRGEITYTNLQGETQKLARASFVRDCQRNYKKASDMVESSIRSMVDDSDLWDRIDDPRDVDEYHKVRLAIWRFVKSDFGLPSVSLTGSEWISRLRSSLGEIIAEIAPGNALNLNLKVRKTGLDANQMELPLLQAQSLFPAIRQETIHQVKGESIDAILVLGSTRFWNSVVKSVAEGTSSEDRRLAYVAMTRARHHLSVALPASHYDKHVETWKAWGFNVL